MGFEWGLRKEKKRSLQHLLFPGSHPSKYWAGPTLLNFSDLVYSVWYGRRKQRLVDLAFKKVNHTLRDKEVGRLVEEEGSISLH